MFNITADYPEYRASTYPNDENFFIDHDFIEKHFGAKRDALEIVVPITIIYCVIFLTGVVGNISTCIVIRRHAALHTATNYYLFSLALSDFLLLITGVPQEIYFIWSKYPYIFGEYFCIGRGLIAETSANATVLTITAFTVERYVAICHPLLLCQAISKLNRAIRIIILIWLISILCAIPQAAQFGIRSFYTIEKCVVVRHIIQHSFQLSTIIFFFVPMSIILVLYILIGLHLYRSSMQIGRNDSFIIQGGGSTLKERKSLTDNESCKYFRRTSSSLNGQINGVRHQFGGTRRVLKMLVAVVICFFLCWAPFHAQRLIAIYGTDISRPLNRSLNDYDDNRNAGYYYMEDMENLEELEKRDHHKSIYTILTYISGILYYLSTCINPLLYNLMSNKYREAFKIVLFGKKSKTSEQQQQIMDRRKTSRLSEGLE